MGEEKSLLMHVSIEGNVTTDPYDFADAVRLVADQKLRGLHIRADELSRTGNPPVVDLDLLDLLPQLESFSISPKVPLSRLENLDGVYRLSNLTRLSMHDYRELDLAQFPLLETFTGTDRLGLIGLNRCQRLKTLGVWKLREGTLTGPRCMTALTSLWLSQPLVTALDVLAEFPSLTTLEVHHSQRIASIVPLPPKLAKLVIAACAQLTNLRFLAGHASLEFLFAERLDSLEMIPTLPALKYLGFQEVGDRDLSPLLIAPSLRRIGAPGNGSYRPTLRDVRAVLDHKNANAEIEEWEKPFLL
jgi:hypothetical protein